MYRWLDLAAVFLIIISVLLLLNSGLNDEKLMSWPLNQFFVAHIFRDCDLYDARIITNKRISTYKFVLAAQRGIIIHEYHSGFYF